jgi:uncharacterized membrane protein
MPIQLIGSVKDGSTTISPNRAGDAQMSPDVTREVNAGNIGLIVVIIFGISVFWLLHLGAVLFTKFNATKIDDFSTFVSGSLDPYLKECATTLGTIFGSTLGFVFGYYFKATSTPAATQAKN